MSEYEKDNCLHVEGTMCNGEHITFDVQTPKKCHEVQKALKLFCPIPEKSSCSEGCTGCSIPANFHIIPFF